MDEPTPPLYSLLYLVLAVVTSPYRRTFKLYTWQPLRQIRAASGDRNILIPLVKDWKADKYNELQSVQVAATFCSGAALSCLPWTHTTPSIWIAEALWFCSLVCAICAIVTSIQAKSILDDLPPLKELNPSLPEAEVQRLQRTILRYKKKPGMKYWIMMFIWQYSSMTMAYAWIAFLAGLTLYICTPFIQHMPWQDRHKIAIAYLAVGCIGLVIYVFSTSFVYASEKDLEQSSALMRTNGLRNSRIDTNDPESGILPGSPHIHTQVPAANRVDSSGVERFAQAALSKAFAEFEQDEQKSLGAAGAGRSKRRLLY